MNEDFPIPIPERLPVRITPCPIVEAVLEIRFVTSEDWSVLPGLLYTEIRGKYPNKENLPLSEMPESIRKTQPDLTHKPLVKFSGEHAFLIQFGPRVVSLIAGRDYPGWQAVHTEMEWLLGKLQAAGFITEGERLGVRYIDFFAGDLFPNLIIQTQIGEQVLTGSEMTVSRVFRKEPFGARLLLNNSVFIADGDEGKPGSVFDLDIRLEAGDFDLFDDGLVRFSEAHELNKQMFFGLLKPDFLATLSPEFD